MVSEEKIQQRSRRPGPIFQKPFSLPENAQTLAGIAFRAAGKSVKNFQQRRNLPENPFQQEFRTATAFSSSLINVARKDKEHIWGPKGPVFDISPHVLWCLETQLSSVTCRPQWPASTKKRRQHWGKKNAKRASRTIKITLCCFCPPRSPQSPGKFK